MTLSISPQQITASHMEVIMASSAALSPGQLLKIEGDPPVYGEINSIQSLSDGGEGEADCLVQIDILLGQPYLTSSKATLLNHNELGGELQAMLGQIQSPLFLGGSFMGDLVKLGPLSFVSGDSLESKHQALVEIMDGLRVNQRLLVVDPLGLFPFAEGYHVTTLGQDVQPALQEIGLPAFLSQVSQMLPDAFRDEALNLLSRALPVTLDFIPFQHLLNLELYEDSPAKVPLIHVLSAMNAQQVFANRLEKILAMDAVVSDQMNVLDLSGIQDPWRGVFYDYICNELVRHKEHGLIPVLVYPENYLTQLPKTIQKLDESEYNVLLLTARSVDDVGVDWASNCFEAEHALGTDDVYVHLCGEMTLGLTVTASLKGLDDELENELEDESDAFEAQALESQTFEPDELNVEETCFPFSENETEIDVPIYEMPLPLALTEAETETELHAPLQTPSTPLSREIPDAEFNIIQPSESQWEAEASPELETLKNIEAPQNLEKSLEENLLEKNLEPELEDGELDFDFDMTFEAPPPPADESAPNPEPPLAENMPEAPHTNEPPQEPLPTSIEAPPTLNDDTLSPPPPDLDAEQEAALNELFPSGEAHEISQDFDFDSDLDATEMTSGMTLIQESPAPQEPTATRNKPLSPPNNRPEIPVYSAMDPESVALVEKVGFQPGDGVSHEKYGLGVVAKIIPGDDRVILNITFDEVGKRLMDAESSSLTRVDS